MSSTALSLKLDLALSREGQATEMKRERNKAPRFKRERETGVRALCFLGLSMVSVWGTVGNKGPVNEMNQWFGDYRNEEVD